jgi:hypothetical protein
MWTHASDQDLMDVLEGAGRVSAVDHVERCDHCRSRLQAAREGLRLAQAADVPEPSPLYWESFRQQVGRRLDSVPAPATWRWTLGPAFAALALTLAVLSVPGLRLLQPAGESGPVLPAWSPPLSAEEDPGLSLIQALAPSEDDLKAGSGGDAATDSLGELSDDESSALAEALRSELQGRNL